MYLDEPVKIGRSVARCRPAQNNATFDCKVLSRNHALVWFDHKTGKVREDDDDELMSLLLFSTGLNENVVKIHTLSCIYLCLLTTSFQ